MTNQYEEKYSGASFYWGKEPSRFCFRILELMPATRPLRLLDVGCGEGRNAVFFARNGYQVTAFDLSQSGVEKTMALATEARVSIDVFQADLLEYRVRESFDIVFCHGCLQYVPPALRHSFLEHIKQNTTPGGLNVMSAFVKKPFIEKAPDTEATSHPWFSGELFTHYHDWNFEFCAETVIDCASSGVPHKHAMDQLIAKRVQ